MQMALLHFLGTNVQWWASNGKWRRGGKIWGRRRRAQYVGVQKTVKYGLSAAGQSQASFWPVLDGSPLLFSRLCRKCHYLISEINGHPISMYWAVYYPVL